jgi:acylphosphatase
VGERVPRLTAIVTGRVQGVGFRDYVQRQAVRRGLTGFVRNRDDGRSVEVVAEGDDSSLSKFVDTLRNGPGMARVDDVDLRMSDEAAEFSRFSVEY